MRRTKVNEIHEADGLGIEVCQDGDRKVFAIVGGNYVVCADASIMAAVVEKLKGATLYAEEILSAIHLRDGSR